MSLQELSEKLHGRDVHLERARQHTPFAPGQGAADPNVQSQFQKTEDWRAPKTKNPSALRELMFSDVSRRRNKWRKVMVLGGVVALILVGGLVFKLRTMLFGEERVEITMTGPQSVASAEETTFTVNYGNKNWAGLENVTLILVYPPAFRPEGSETPGINGSVAEITLGEIKANSEGKKIITGKFYGFKGDVAYLKATLRYSPKGASSVFEKSAQLGVNISSSPLSLEITAPLQLASGQDVEYVVDYGNVSDLKFSNLRVKLEYPEGFQFVSSEPRPSEGEVVWYVGNLDARAQGKIKVHGIFSGVGGEQKRVRGVIGLFQEDGKFLTYAESERPTRVVASPFAISQTVNGLTDVTASPGEILRYVINYKNESKIGMRDVIVTVEINPELLDMGQLTLQKGVYDASRKIIIWKASDIPGLGKIESGAGGELSFSVPVLATISAENVQHLSIKSIAKIDSPDVPMMMGSNKIIGSNTLLVKLNSVVGIDMKAFYEDAVFPNSGPLPPKVGRETSYTFHLKVANSSNNLKEARVSVLLPTGVRYTEKFAPAEETVVFNERTNELVWELGVFAPTKSVSRELIFQVAAVPSPNNFDKPLILINNTTFTAKDAFTNQNIRIENGQEDNFLRYDPKYNLVSSYVQAAE